MFAAGCCKSGDNLVHRSSGCENCFNSFFFEKGDIFIRYNTTAYYRNVAGPCFAQAFYYSRK